MQLNIDSTSNTKLVLSLDQKKMVIEYDSPRNQDILFAISQLLTQEGVLPTQLTAVTVATGPGNFTSLRVGFTIAQMLSFTLNIPLNGQTANSKISLDYGKPPSITQIKYEDTDSGI